MHNLNKMMHFSFFHEDSSYHFVKKRINPLHQDPQTDGGMEQGPPSIYNIKSGPTIHILHKNVLY